MNHQIYAAEHPEYVKQKNAINNAIYNPINNPINSPIYNPIYSARRKERNR